LSAFDFRLLKSARVNLTLCPHDDISSLLFANILIKEQSLRSRFRYPHFVRLQIFVNRLFRSAVNIFLL